MTVTYKGGTRSISTNSPHGLCGRKATHSVRTQPIQAGSGTTDSWNTHKNNNMRYNLFSTKREIDKRPRKKKENRNTSTTTITTTTTNSNNNKIAPCGMIKVFELNNNTPPPTKTHTHTEWNKQESK